MTRTVFGNELLKTIRKWRSFISFGAIAVVVPLVHIAVKLEGGGWSRGLTRGLSADFVFIGNPINGYFLTVFLMNALWIHVPFLITLGAGDQLAGEATGGTYRLLLIRPASRSFILLMKYLTTLVYATVLVVFMAIISIGLGVLLFGAGDLLVPGQTIVILSRNEALPRLLLAFAAATVGMWTVASLAFFLSSLVENGIGPIVGTMAVIIVFYIVSNVPVELFTSIKPWLFTTYLDVWRKVLDEPIPWTDVARSLGILGGHCVGFYLATWYIFAHKDILS